MDLNFDDADKPILSDEEANQTAGFVDTCSDKFDQLLPTTNQSEPEITEEQQEIIRQNKERAQRLREERLKKIRDRAESSLEQSGRLPTLDSQISIGNSQIDNTALTNNCPREMNEVWQTNELVMNCQNTTNNQVEDVDHLDFININEPSTSKNRKRLESDGVGQTIDERNEVTIKSSNIRRHILDSDDEESIKAKSSAHKNSRKIADSHEKSEDVDIDNILTEINTDANSISTSGTEIEINERNKVNDLEHQNEMQNMENYGEKDDIENILHEINTNDSSKVNNENDQHETSTKSISEENEELQGFTNHRRQVGNNNTDKFTN